MNGRRARVAKIHIARQKLAMEEDSYRAMLERITGHRSSTDCTDGQLDLVLQEFKRLGFHDARKASSQKAYVRKIYGIWGDLKPFLRDPSDGALRAFIRRQTKTAARPSGVAAPEFLGPEDGNLVIEGLKAWLTRERRAKKVETATSA